MDAEAKTRTVILSQNDSHLAARLAFCFGWQWESVDPCTTYDECLAFAIDALESCGCDIDWDNDNIVDFSPDMIDPIALSGGTQKEEEQVVSHFWVKVFDGMDWCQNQDAEIEAEDNRYDETIVCLRSLIDTYREILSAKWTGSYRRRYTIPLFPKIRESLERYIAKYRAELALLHKEDS